MRLLVDEDTASATLITRLLAAGHEVVQLPHGTLDEVIFNEAQRLALPILTANVGRKGRRDPVEFYQLACYCLVYQANSSSSALASWRSGVSKPSVNQP